MAKPKVGAPPAPTSHSRRVQLRSRIGGQTHGVQCGQKLSPGLEWHDQEERARRGRAAALEWAVVVGLAA